MPVIRVPSPTPQTVRDVVISAERNLDKEFATIIHEGVKHSNVKAALQYISQTLSKTSTSIVDALPLIFNLDQKPFTLERHFFLEPLFSSHVAENTVFMCARQVGKSLTGIAATKVAMCMLRENMKILTVAPLYEQIRRLSQNYVKPFIDQSPIRSLMVSPQNTSSILQRDFLNGSILYFSYAFTSVTRVRGISTHAIMYDELDDFDPEYPPIINQCAASAPPDRRFIRRFGTPKTLDTLMSYYWQISSQAEWQIRCPHCGHWNIPSLEHDLDAMIGPKKPRWKVCQETPCIVCAGRSKVDGKRCGKPLNPRLGMWVHRYPEKRFNNAGYYVPQMILPQHCEESSSWAKLLGYREGADNTTPAKFYNEICGIPYDGSSKLITLTDLKRACNLPTEINKITEASEYVKKKQREGVYTHTVLSVDWGGGGKDELSFTTLAVVCLRYDGKIDIPFGYRSLTPHDHEKETQEILSMKRIFGCSHVIHDGCEIGIARETALRMSGLPNDAIVRIRYVRVGKGDVMRWIGGDIRSGERASWTLDKARGLVYTVAGIKNGYLNFFKYDRMEGGKLGLIDDFLSLIEDKQSSRFASDVYTIIRSSTTAQPDDFTSAVCFAYHYLYGVVMKRYPNMDYLKGSNIKALSEDLIARIEGDELET